MYRQRYIDAVKSTLFHTAVMIMAAMLVFPLTATAAAASTIRILVVPFTINAGQDLGFLQRGITEMLISRLGQHDTVQVVTTSRSGDDIAALTRKCQADYVVLGSFTVLGERISTDCRVIKGSQVDNPVLSFGRTGHRQADVLDHIDDLAGQINGRILGRNKIELNQAATVAPVVVPTPSAERTIEKQAARSAQSDSGVGRPVFSSKDADALVPLRLQGIGDFDEQLNGVAVDDVDGDGAVEIVAIGESRLYIYRLTQGRWTKTADIDGTGKYIGVDTADLNRNGRKEIFVTNFDYTEGRAISFVMEWDGQSFQRIAGQLPWYFRAVNVTSRGKVLLGQKQSIGDRFTPGIYEIKWQAGKYGPGDRLSLPCKLNIFGFAYGAVRSADKPEVVTYSSGGYVQLLDDKGKEAFVSTESYGGSSNAIVFTDEEQYDVQDYIFMPLRIHLHDMDGDGIQEILVINNETSMPGGGGFVRHRYYKKGRMEWLRWQGEGIRSTVQSLDVSRFISDSALADIDGNGELEIVAVVVKTTRSVTTKGSSYLTAFKNEPATTTAK